ncbi:hypothetical protein Dimus_024456, partial [Dionaea muscipula]
IVVPRYGKRDTTSFMDLTYMDHILTRRLVNLPRLMMRHMAYVISVENHEMPYRDWITMREQGVRWLDIGGIRRRDVEDEIPAENDQNEEVANEGHNQEDFEWEAVNEEAEIQGESGSAKKFFDTEDDVQGDVDVVEEVPDVPA